jgi:hypothetical protein
MQLIFAYDSDHLDAELRFYDMELLPHTGSRTSGVRW